VEALAIWWAENDQAEMELWREPVLELEEIQEPPSHKASMSSVANDGLNFSADWRAAGRGSLMSLRLRLMMNNVPMMHEKAANVTAATVEV
jgi:hypothetical protein